MIATPYASRSTPTVLTFITYEQHSGIGGVTKYFVSCKCKKSLVPGYLALTALETILSV
jgi:hypothetical protein